jgi:hypothetical protein
MTKSSLILMAVPSGSIGTHEAGLMTKFLVNRDFSTMYELTLSVTGMPARKVNGEGWPKTPTPSFCALLP